ncbi:hypothetical protein [Elongatibacter sediminis]|uniref:Uncharacterized protein n=1 Tax=Elongatibacter sediminis TaxID=3119006 RepID=A0AAW9RKC6_9GAMM
MSLNVRTGAIVPASMLIALLCLLSFPAQALYENYLSNYTTPIPPACVTNVPVLDDFNFSGSEVLSDEVVTWIDTEFVEQDLAITVWQMGCPEPGRRILMVTLELLDDQDGVADMALLPWAWGRVAGDPTRYRFRLNVEPNTNQARDDVTGLLYEGVESTFIMDTPAPLAEDFNADQIMLAGQYNGAFELELEDPEGFTSIVQIPRYKGTLTAPDMTLTGRLSGNWVTPGAADQGFVLAFEELAEESEGLFFLSWYTYDGAGDLLWLTGAATYDLQAAAVSFDIELVTNGQFLGGKPADRQVVGSGTISAFDCYDLEFVYDLSALGLGSAIIPLRRLFALEIQGYACGDSATRIEHINDGG